MLRKRNNLIVDRGLLPDDVTCISDLPEVDYATLLAECGATGILPNHPAFEKHPYLDLIEMGNYAKYLVGTFPPISYVADVLQIEGLAQPNGHFLGKPWIPFFHGNRGSMWEYLLSLDEYQELVDLIPGDINNNVSRANARNFLVQRLTQMRVNYSDVIKFTQRSLSDNHRYTSEDSKLWNICINEQLILQLLNNDKATTILFNTGSSFTNTGLRILPAHARNGPFAIVNVDSKCSSFDLFIRGCQELGLQIAIRIIHGPTEHFDWCFFNQAQRLFLQMHIRRKLIFELRIIGQVKNNDFDREFTVITPASPAAVNRGRTRQNRIIQRWRDLHFPNDAINHNTVGDFVRHVYQTFRLGDVHQLYNYNCE